MTKSDLISRRDAFERWDRKFNIYWSVAFFALLIANLVLVKRLPKEYSSLFLILFFAFLFLNLFLVLWIPARRRKKEAPRCPNCNDYLEKEPGRLAVATGKCGKCGTSLFAV